MRAGLTDAGSLTAWLFWSGCVTAAALLPNARRTLRPVVPGYAGRDFLPITPGSDDSYTFDLSVLSGGVRIESIAFFTIEAADAATAEADADPSARIIAGPTLDSTGSKVTVRLGNFLDGLAPLRYRLGPTVLDANGNEFDSWSIAPAAMRGAAVAASSCTAAPASGGASAISGPPGWTPVPALVVYGAGVVLRIADWLGSGSVKPATGYVGPSGLVQDIALATVIPPVLPPRALTDANTPGGVYTLGVTDYGRPITVDSASPFTIVCPLLPDGFIVPTVHQLGAGAVAFAADAGATVNSFAGYTKTAGIGAQVGLKAVNPTGAAAGWWISGEGAA